MKKQISFVSGLFETGVTKQDESGDRLLGEDLARWLIDKCRGDEFTFTEPVQDQSGWSNVAEAEGQKFKLGYEIIHASVGDAHAEWRITIEKLRSWGIFGAKDSALRGRLCDLIHNVLREEGEMREVQWGR